MRLLASVLANTALALLLSACAAPPPPAFSAPLIVAAAPPPPPLPAPPPTVTSAPEPRPPPERKARVRFDDRIDAPSPPLVDATVGGQPTQLIVDTGASHHVIAGWLARELDAGAARPAGRATEHQGRSVAVSRLDGLGLTISGYGRVEAASLLVVEVPDELRRRGIGGVISPQALVAEGRALLLDFPAGTMSELGAAEGARRLEAKGPSYDAIRRCAGPGAGGLVARATINGLDAGLALDTGSTTSSLSMAAAPGLRLDKRQLGSGTQVTASGLHTVSTAPGVRVALGPFAAELDLDLLPRAPAPGCGEGYAGMDVLRSCALLIGGPGARLSCAPRR